ncbi:MAG: cupin domain-containing protein [Rhodospirillaceae bacterium]|nr:cupin domain-containing protein [Rhodospirillaceae bacterium]MDE0617611.1 cupin domain-containing protein [Rhodospirillaceae bacterium]
MNGDLGQDDDKSLRLGRQIRHWRLVKGLTLRDMAKLVGCSESLLSKIENDRATPSLSTLHKIAVALGLNISDIFGSGESEVVTRANERNVLLVDGDESDGDRMRLEQLVPAKKGRLLQADMYIIPPGGGSNGEIQHSGEEFGVVMEGSLFLTIENTSYFLEAGDSFVFRSELAHSFANNGSTVARVLWVNTPPTF